ncbi:cadmium resistance transporter [Rivularia sp. IAM M-261]|nr:cadmium resistance transporter [Rivularia sp. IAM M-261]
MEELIASFVTGFTAFTATNLDDLVILTLFFSQVNSTFHRRHIVIGQYLGFTLLVIVSIPGFFGGLILPDRWIGLLGLAPIAIGLNQWMNKQNDDFEEENNNSEESQSSFFSSVLSPQVYSVAAITVANGSDNISIYVPLFANTEFGALPIIVGVFFTLVGVWCYASYLMTKQELIANTLTNYGSHLVPFVLVGLGVYIILESHALSPLALLASSICLVGIVKKTATPEIEEN